MMCFKTSKNSGAIIHPVRDTKPTLDTGAGAPHKNASLNFTRGNTNTYWRQAVS